MVPDPDGDERWRVHNGGRSGGERPVYLNTEAYFRDTLYGVVKLRGAGKLTEDSAGRMSRIGRAQLVHGEVLPVEEVAARIQAVTVDDVAAVAKRVLGNRPVLAVVGPFESTARFEPFVASAPVR